ncbi:conjugal transfer protein [Pseudalkalibacillus sp. SCS-8]|uniref:conjugal transfer protein n=1 Tax=Pseudalkalibacillus nanhaiensis TaxID=3115291 RepID=UPI0032DA35DF
MKLKGENFTPEYKYPIKIYRIGSIEFANGLEVRKMIFSFVLAILLVIGFVMIGVQGDHNLLGFVAKNWLILITVIPGIITFVVFNLQYDNKKFIPFLKGRVRFYRTKETSYEHFIEVASEQMGKEMVFEPHMKAGEDE